ncbi:helix-turn-helix transcriptional regulator [Hyphomicrobium zavarzinii]|jgi:prophage regulatory protein|uniref:helix-turn-helix transcriptional regulator n=1 Tax=Hyphomicrobium zavarzinii TaxID=48292 RepID=UPI0009FD523D|nr:AlpA family phage regulatory protein [Hyphomicrobium zavarzinii]
MSNTDNILPSEALSPPTALFIPANLISSFVVYSYPNILRLEAQGLFPARIRLSPRTSVWSADEVVGWMQSKIDTRAGYTSPILTIHDRFLDLKRLRRLVPYSRTHLDRLEAAKRFPRRLSLGEKRTVWLEREVREWIACKAHHDSPQRPFCHCSPHPET